MSMKLSVTAVIALASSACTMNGPTQETPARAPSVRPPVAATAEAGVSVTLSASQVALVKDYFGTEAVAGSSSRRRGRNGGLPPGIARNLQRGKPLPSGIARQVLPGDLLVRLPGTPSGLEYLVVAGKLLLVETATQVVRDVLLETVVS